MVYGSGPPIVVNDDGHVFPWADDDLTRDDLRIYLASYCRPSVTTVAYCVGDMSWPTFYPTTVGTYFRSSSDASDIKRTRLNRNLGRFESVPGGYLGATFTELRALGKRVLASFRMNDAHLAHPGNSFVSDFWRAHSDVTLGEPFGYYGGCLDYSVDAVREHFLARVSEFVDLYPEIDGIELDAMRSPFFFPAGEGRRRAPLLTELIRAIRNALYARAQASHRTPYALTMNVPMRPELAADCGLDVARWEAEGLVDRISVGPYQTSMDLPIDSWRRELSSTPIDAYIGVSPQTGQYLGLEEYRAATCASLAAGADGIYLFNLPCLHELVEQIPTRDVDFTWPDARMYGQPDLRLVTTFLDELGDVHSIRKRTRRYLFYWNQDGRYHHFSPTPPSAPHGQALNATFPWDGASDEAHVEMEFKIANVARGEKFGVLLNGRQVGDDLEVSYAPNGRDNRIHTDPLPPYSRFRSEVAREHLRVGRNTLRVEPLIVEATLESTPIQLCELALRVEHEPRVSGLEAAGSLSGVGRLKDE